MTTECTIDPKLELSSTAVIVPTLNAASEWPRLTQAISAQGIAPRQVLIVDSESTDGTPDAARRCGYRVEEISRAEFNHGGTRQWALQFFPNAEIVVFLTQDAIPASYDSLKKLLAVFDDPTVAAAFGRQLPRESAGPIEVHARLFNYPPISQKRSLASRNTLGFKAIFLSNSFAAYRRRALDEVGGFPSHVIMGEDTVTAARFLLRGWQVAYVADAEVFHSHPYSGLDEFKRYFDTGVLHSRESWLLDEFGKTNGEGLRFVQSELSYLVRHNPALIPAALWRTVLKFGGYRLGRLENRLRPALKRRLSMHHRFWVAETPEEYR
jgi:rhamnosyltransferase